MKQRPFFQSLAAYLDWYHQPPGRFIALRPGCDLTSIVLRHEEEIRKLAQEEGKRGKGLESEAT